MKITVNAVIENLESVTAFVDSALEAADCPVKAQMQIDVALDEIFSNVAYYAYAPDTGDITIDIETNKGGAVLTFTDSGIPFDPLKASDPNIHLSAEERAVGGLGIFMVKKTMDSVSYEYSNGCNILTIKKGW